MDSAGKKTSQMDPAHGPPLQARVAAANRTVLQLAHCCNKRRSWRTWKEQGQQSKMTGRGQMLRRAVGMAGKEWQQAHSPQNRHCRRTQPADSPPGTGLKQTASSWPASRLAVQGDGGSAVVLAARKAGADLPTLSLPHLTPLPVTVPTHSLNL